MVASRESVIGKYRIPAGGDVVLAVEGHAVESSQHLMSAIDRYKPGDRITMTVLRDNRRLDLLLVLAENPKS